MEKNKEVKTRDSYHIEGMHCGGCANTVERKLAAVPEIESVKVDLAKKQVVILSDKAMKLSDLNTALSDTSYIISKLNTGNQ
jgi:Cu2+-exporting ATPase